MVRLGEGDRYTWKSSQVHGLGDLALCQLSNDLCPLMLNFVSVEIRDGRFRALDRDIKQKNI